MRLVCWQWIEAVFFIARCMYVDFSVASAESLILFAAYCNLAVCILFIWNAILWFNLISVFINNLACCRVKRPVDWPYAILFSEVIAADILHARHIVKL